jgi:tagatose-1,6-bisphosphate aldolase non-catalytic subunit AgaZ/GatZ
VLNAKIVAVNIPGVDLTDPRIVQMNQQMADALSKSVGESNGAVLFKEATVKVGSFHIKIQVNIPTK